MFKELQEKFPDDLFLTNHDRKLRESRPLLRWQRSYERALDVLDERAWNVVRQKAMQQFPQRTSDRGKQQFFEILNEAFAYRFLLRSGFEDISFVEEEDPRARRKKGQQAEHPDLQFFRNTSQIHCEVKTINRSNDQLKRDRSIGVVYDSSVFELGSPFFEKLGKTVSKATQQLAQFGTRGIVYLIIHPDDWTLDNIEEDKRQIKTFLKAKFPSTDIVAKFGVYGRRHLRISRTVPAITHPAPYSAHARSPV
ncbi:MAG: hypothetical protein JF617_15090 [Burkholderiales bacterium]|nr:hypothetical protein [Burkholderiales bacterium]